MENIWSCKQETWNTEILDFMAGEMFGAQSKNRV